jgi:TRAP-type C4-dicarboxylate transport system substrate-binding protein
MTSLQISQSVGATIMNKKDFDKLSPELQKQLLADSMDLQKKVLKTIREDNTKSLASLKSSGIQVIDSPKPMVDDFMAQAVALRSKLEPSVYTHEFRMKVEKLLADYRAGKK